MLEALGVAAPAQRLGAATAPGEGPGVYTVWDEAGRFLYVGTAGAGGVQARLRSHAAGRRLGDPFCVLVADRLVLPLLTPPEVTAIAAGRHSLDALVRAHIRRRLLVRFAVVGTAAEARGWEQTLRRGAWEHGAPLLDPAPGVAPPDAGPPPV